MSEVEQLKKEVEALKKRIEELERRLDNIKRELGIIEVPKEPEHKFIDCTFSNDHRR